MGRILFATDRNQQDETNISVARLREILQELDADHENYPCGGYVELSLGDGKTTWNLSAYPNGSVVWSIWYDEAEQDYDPKYPEGSPVSDDDAEGSDERYMAGVSREEVLALWLKLAKGDIEAIEAQPWLPGHGPPLSEQERAELLRQIEEEELASDKAFYDSLSQEREGIPCRHPGCSRNAIHYSVLCRPHHFENVRKRPCPFTD
jgi:hypothetical protein